MNHANKPLENNCHLSSNMPSLSGSENVIKGAAGITGGTGEDTVPVCCECGWALRFEEHRIEAGTFEIPSDFLFDIRLLMSRM